MYAKQPAISAIALVLAAQLAARTFAAEDVMLQTIGGKIVTGIIDDGSGEGTLGTRVYRGNFLSNFRAANPGFFGLTSVSPNLPPGASGFPSNHDIYFDLLPMKVGNLKSNLLFWDGADLGGNGLGLEDVQFSVPADVNWEVRDDFNIGHFANGSDQLVIGGRIDATSSDTNPGDGIDTGMLHKHLALLLNSTTEGGMPAAGVYVLAWQSRAAGFETSDPFVFVHRTSTAFDAARNLAATWIEGNLDSMFPSILPGDYNDDELVDAGDYTVWRDLLGSSINLPNEDASPNVVDAADYDVWKANFGTSAANGTAALTSAIVPELTTFLLALVAALALPIALPRGRRPRVTNLDQLGGDTDGDFAGLVLAERQTNWAAKLVGGLSRNSDVGQFAQHDFAFSHTADHAQVCRLPSLAKDLFKNRPIRPVAHRHQDDKIIVREIYSFGLHVVRLNLAELPRLRQLGKPFGPRIDAHDLAFHFEQTTNERLRDVPGAKDDNSPRLVIVCFEIQLHDAAARHSHVALQVPLDKLRRRCVLFAQHTLSKSDRLVFHASAADGSKHQSARLDEHLGTSVLRRAADGVDHRHRHKRPAATRKFGQFLDESVRCGHRDEGSGTGRQSAGSNERRAVRSTIAVGRRDGNRSARRRLRFQLRETAQNLFTGGRQTQINPAIRRYTV
jgi:hypothetical protein